LDNAPELFRLLVQALALFATWLDRVFHIPWPLVLAVFFVPVVAALDVGVWYLRGMAFPIPCGYLTVRGKTRCRRMTVGEWHKCWYHRRRRLRRTDQHVVDPTMRRWQARLQDDDPGKFVSSVRVVGRGFLSKRSHRDTLLYHQGFARPPQDVRKIMPEVLGDYKSRAADRWASLRSLGLRGLIPLTDRASQQIATSKVLPSVINATRLTLTLVALGLLLVGVSIAVAPTIRVFPEYLAAFAFTFALAFTLFGILKAEPDWFGHSSAKAGKWIAGFMLVATLFGLFGLFADDIINAAIAVAKIAFTGLILLGALYLAIGKKSRSRRRRRRRW
jgi:hypothetical protein